MLAVNEHRVVVGVAHDFQVLVDAIDIRVDRNRHWQFD